VDFSPQANYTEGLEYLILNDSGYWRREQDLLTETGRCCPLITLDATDARFLVSGRP
jgi:hypothetical protein